MKLKTYRYLTEYWAGASIWTNWSFWSRIKIVKYRYSGFWTLLVVIKKPALNVMAARLLYQSAKAWVAGSKRASFLFGGPKNSRDRYQLSLMLIRVQRYRALVWGLICIFVFFFLFRFTTSTEATSVSRQHANRMRKQKRLRHRKVGNNWTLQYLVIFSS